MIKIYFQLTILISLIFIGCEKKADKKPNANHVVHSLSSGSYDVNTTESRLEWSGRKVAYGHNGTLMIKNGSVEILSNGNINGKFDIDMNSINVTDLEGGRKNSLEGHLKAADFFDVVQFPIASIVFRANKKNIKDNRIDINADLTIKNITHPINFTASIIDSQPQLKMKANIVFDRSKYDVRFGSGKFFQNLGDKMILDDINVAAHLNFN